MTAERPASLGGPHEAQQEAAHRAAHGVPLHGREVAGRSRRAEHPPRPAQVIPLGLRPLRRLNPDPPAQLRHDTHSPESSGADPFPPGEQPDMGV